MSEHKLPKRKVHPAANLFPMMTDEELANLAADIKANGLIHAIVVDYRWIVKSLGAGLWPRSNSQSQLP
jgi:ParB-like chromosome segregation protein Spo0J